MDTISQAIDIKDGRGVIRLFDPCAGQGQALERLAASIQHKAARPVETWGVESSPDRARQAARRLDTVVEAPFETTTWSPSVKSPVSPAFVNPPYDHNGSGGRLEQDFLERVTHWLADGELLPKEAWRRYAILFLLNSSCEHSLHAPHAHYCCDCICRSRLVQYTRKRL